MSRISRITGATFSGPITILQFTQPAGRTETLTTRYQAAFELLTDDSRHGIALQV